MIVLVVIAGVLIARVMIAMMAVFVIVSVMIGCRAMRLGRACCRRIGRGCRAAR